MRVLKDCEPRNVFYFFEEICRIPHGSGNITGISNYLADFAAKRGLEHYQDEIGNIIIIKEASEGYEDHKPVMLQGHMDMVAVKKPGYEIDMEKEGLRLKTEDGRIYAEGTSLGGDDGIAVAYGLALLDSNVYRHPRLELVITVDEETGMDGARAIDLSPCRAKQLINLDSEEEGIFLAGCAGGARVNFEASFGTVRKTGIPCKIKVSGLMGGHSGAEIHKERGNANCLLIRSLRRLSMKTNFCMIALEGGLADNAIPREAEAEILVTGYQNQNGMQFFKQEGFAQGECLTLLRYTAEKINRELKTELGDKDPGVCLELTAGAIREEACVEEEKTGQLTAFLNAVPNGVQAMSAAMPGLVETSLNLGILKVREGRLNAGISVRSSYDGAKKALIHKLQGLAGLLQVTATATGDYPGWVYKKDSPLRDKMTEVYKKCYNKEPLVEAIHAGLECGLFADMIPELDCVSIGPDMKNIHTTEEELSIASAERVWNYLIRLLEEM